MVGNRIVDDGYRVGKQLANAAFALAPADDAAFAAIEAEVTRFQRERCPFFERYCLSSRLSTPFLPVDAFGHFDITTFPIERAEAVFVSSGTTSNPSAAIDNRSRHLVRDLDIYRASVIGGYSFTGLPTHSSRQPVDRGQAGGGCTVLAHLPGYVGPIGDVEQSSLVSMAKMLMEEFGTPGSGFFLEDTRALHTAANARGTRPQIVLIGAAFGLLDLVDSDEAVRLGPDDVVIETGGMKTRRQEVSRRELHTRLADGFGIDPEQIWSEYGMCEMLSQYYMQGQSGFAGPPWTRYAIVNPEDPEEQLEAGMEGRLAIIDLANVFTVSTLLTGDRAVRTGQGFEVLGRLDSASLRGCNFLVEAALEAAKGTS